MAKEYEGVGGSFGLGTVVQPVIMVAAVASNNQTVFKLKELFMPLVWVRRRSFIAVYPNAQADYLEDRYEQIGFLQNRFDRSGFIRRGQLRADGTVEPVRKAWPIEHGFFVTSVGSGKGADFGGLAGADKHCQSLASAAGAGNRTWRAYLSTQGASAVNARDRIGQGPWQNVKGVVIARNVDELHGSNASGWLLRDASRLDQGRVCDRRAVLLENDGPVFGIQPAAHPLLELCDGHRIVGPLIPGSARDSSARAMEGPRPLRSET